MKRLAPPPSRKYEINSVQMAQDYIDDVVCGRLKVGKLVRLAVERHLDDLENASTRGFYFDESEADRVLRFFNLLRHSKGRQWAGGRFILSPWQAFIIYVLFGWKREQDDSRRFRTGYVSVARKNGKSTLAAGIGIYLLLGDNEPGAEVYSAATKRDQAKIVFNEARNMFLQSDDLSRFVRPYMNSILVPSTTSKFEPLSSDARSLDGLNTSGAIIDEFHAHSTREVWDVINTSTGSRFQPLIFTITTAGHELECACFELEEFAVQVLRGTVPDDSLFAYVAHIDEEDDWNDPACWVKANPNLGVSVSLDNLMEQFERARKIPSEQNAFRTKRLNMWVQQSERWIDLGLWDENEAGGIEDISQLLHRDCYGALDLASVSDLTAWVTLFPRPDNYEEMDVLCRFWCPEARLYDDRNRYRFSYQKWKQMGWLTTTPGDAIDYDRVKKEILEDINRYNYRTITVDMAFQGYKFCQELEEACPGIEITGMRPGLVTMSPLVDSLDLRLLKRFVHHRGNPVLRWMADNVTLKWDGTGQLKKPVKQNSQCKIDGIISLLMALDGLMRDTNQGPVGEFIII